MFTAQPRKLTGTPIFAAYGNNPSSTAVWILRNAIKLYPAAFLVLVVAPNSAIALHHVTRIANLEQMHTLSPLKMAICYTHAQSQPYVISLFTMVRSATGNCTVFATTLLHELSMRDEFKNTVQIN